MIDKKAIKTATYNSKKKVEKYIRLGAELTLDPEKEYRSENQLCLSCFYISSGLAGQAFTTRECSNCQEEKTYPTTYTDALCLECAKELELCKHCMSEIEIK